MIGTALNLEIRQHNLDRHTAIASRSTSEAPPSCILFGTQSTMSTTLYPLASLAQIEKTPSREDGLPDYLEEDLRAYGCRLIHEAGILLKQCVHTLSAFHPSM